MKVLKARMNVTRQPLYLQIAQTLQREIPQRYPPGALLDVADLQSRFGVSTLTLREALGVLVRQGYIERHKGRGTYVSHSYPRPHVGIVSELDLFDRGVSFFYRRVTQVLRTFFRTEGMRVRLYIGHTRPATEATGLTCDDLAEDLANGQIRSLVAVAMKVPPELRELSRQAAVPVVSASSGSDGCVMLDHADFVRCALDELVAAGRRRIAILGSVGVSSDTLIAMLKERGCAVHTGWLQAGLHPSLPGAGWETFMTAWAAAPERPNGLLVADDMLFEEAAAAILTQGISVPKDLYVITHANRGAWRRLLIPAVCYEVDPDEVGRVMGEMALRLMGANPGSHEEAILRFRRVEPDHRQTPWLTQETKMTSSRGGFVHA